jgi:uncharacterized membrane protein YagU involved in acid resistance
MPSIAGMLIRGAVAGTAATWLMDIATTAVQKAQPPEHAERERAAWPNGQSSVLNLVDRVADGLGIRLNEASRSAAANVTHYALGTIPGAAYAVLRGRLPAIGAGRGLAYGALLWAVNDEIVNTQLGLAGSWRAYPTMTHIRGLIGHLVLGVGTDLGIDLLGGASHRHGHLSG